MEGKWEGLCSESKGDRRPGCFWYQPQKQQ